MLGPAHSLLSWSSASLRSWLAESFGWLLAGGRLDLAGLILLGFWLDFDLA